MRSNRLVMTVFHTILRYGVITTASIYIVMYLIVALLRLRYPYELEWMEGTSLDAVHRIREGLSIYLPASLEYIPNNYTPLYYYIVAVCTYIIGIHFFTLRIVSYVASILSILLIYLLVHRESKDRYPAFIAAGLYAATFQISGSWFDTARVDSFFVLLLLLHTTILTTWEFRYKHLIAGVTFTLCLFAKQTGLLLLPFTLLYYLFFNKKNLPQYVFSFLFSMVVLFGLYDWSTHHWFVYYIFLPQHDAMLVSKFISFWSDDLLRNLLYVCPVVLIGLAITLIKESKKRFLKYILLFVGFIAISIPGRIKFGGYVNTLMPAYGALCILYGLSMANIRKVYPTRGALIVSLVTIIQFGLLWYNPLDQIPSAHDRLAGDRIVQYIKRTNGPVLIPYSSYLTRYGGKGGQFHIAGLWELHGGFGGAVTPEGIKMRKVITHEISQKSFSAIIVNDRAFLPFGSEIAKYYKLVGSPIDDNSFFPIVGWKTRPIYLYVPL